MGEFLFQYTPVAPTTWAYLASLLMIGLFFKFNGFWRVRNLDLVLLILLAPGLLLLHFADELEVRSLAGVPEVEASLASELVPDETSGSAQVAGLDPPATERMAADASHMPSPESRAREARFLGYLWLFGVNGVLLFRTLLDPRMVRRPLLEPNLTTGGLTFIGCSLFVFLAANVLAGKTTDADLKGPRSAVQLLRADSMVDSRPPVESLATGVPAAPAVAEKGALSEGLVAPAPDGELAREESWAGERGPGNAFLHLLPAVVTLPFKTGEDATAEKGYVSIAKTMAILSHLAVVIGMVAIGYRHFSNIKMGIGAATLYLMLPYTAQMTGRVTHVLPAALLIWAILFYRRPLTAGLLIGMAIGVMYYPLFLLPLWLSFYWPRGLTRFVSGVVGMLAFNALVLVFLSPDLEQYASNLRAMLGIWWPRMDGLGGIWGLGWSPVFRIPILTAFTLLSFSFAIWPARKNLGTLLSCSSAVMIATQFWHGDGGGLFMGWYLPTLILTIFRPNLEDRIALTVLGEGWKRRTSVSKADRAA